MFKMKILITVIVLLFSKALVAGAKPVVSVYSYHLKAPLIIDQEAEQGLYYDFVNYLNSNNSKYHFKLVYLPRKRIERLLDSESLDGILLGVNPVWFKDKNETKYLWTREVFTDRDEIVSLMSSAFEFKGPESITSKVFGGVRGFYYFGINEVVEQKKVLRVDVIKEVDLFKMLLLGRVDLAVISRSTFDYMIKENDWPHEFYLSKQPHDIYDRRVLVPKNQEYLFELLNEIVIHLPYDKSWQAKILEYK